MPKTLRISPLNIDCTPPPQQQSIVSSVLLPHDDQRDRSYRLPARLLLSARTKNVCTQGDPPLAAEFEKKGSRKLRRFVGFHVVFQWYLYLNGPCSRKLCTEICRREKKNSGDRVAPPLCTIFIPRHWRYPFHLNGMITQETSQAMKHTAYFRDACGLPSASGCWCG